MKALFTTLTLIILLAGVTNSYSQSSDQINREENPEQTVLDNSPLAQLKKQIYEAKKNGNDVLHKQLTQQFANQYPEKIRNSVESFNRLTVAHQDGMKTAPFMQGDWGAGDINVFPRSIFQGSGVNQRVIDLEVDSSGVKYLGFITGDRDSLKIFRSTNEGVNWTQIQALVAGAGTMIQAFDFSVTDSANTFRLGFAVTVSPDANENDADLYWVSMRGDGTGARIAVIKPKDAGNGWKNPSIISDGWNYSAGATYWYVSYQRVNSGTGAGNQAAFSWTTDWGFTWEDDTTRNTFNDYYLSVNYNAYVSSDSLYVLLANDLTVTNANLRLMRIALGNLGTSTAWSQYNIGTANPEDQGELAVNRQNNQMAVIYRETFGVGAGNIRYQYSDHAMGINWTQGPDIAAFDNNEERPRIDCQQRQGAWRISFVSQSATYDTVVYMSSTNITSAFSGKTIVNPGNDCGLTPMPDVAGFRTGAASFGGGVAFSRFSSNNLWYDGSNVTPTDITNNSSLAGDYTLSQNYPNPFNPSTKINFSIPVKGFVSLKVFDALGREVATLVNNELNSGSYTYDFNAGKLGSGIYFYKLTSGNFNEVKKMMLIK
ncbi:MAG TPA: hypothetical protein DEP28_07555 [Bacteroidetes bacterium]|nr:hypothetical protein [Bacteroidota bacterium]